MMTRGDHAPVGPVGSDQPRSIRIVYRSARIVYIVVYIAAGICIALLAVGIKGLDYYNHYVDASRIAALRDDIAALKIPAAIRNRGWSPQAGDAGKSASTRKPSRRARGGGRPAEWPGGEKEQNGTCK